INRDESRRSTQQGKDQAQTDRPEEMWMHKGHSISFQLSLRGQGCRCAAGLKPCATGDRLSHVNARPAPRVVLRLTQYFAGYRGRIPFTECQELQEVRNRVALRPSKIYVWDLFGLIADEEQERSDGIGDGRTLTAKHPVTTDIDSFNPQHLAELRRVAGSNFEKQHRIVGRQGVRPDRLPQLVLVLLHEAGVGPVGDDADALALACRGPDEFLRLGVSFAALPPQLGR